MSVRCKMKVIRVGIPFYYPNLELMPVYADEPGSENERFFNATPSGELKLGVQNEAALAQFKPGDEFYVDFTKAD